MKKLYKVSVENYNFTLSSKKLDSKRPTKEYYPDEDGVVQSICKYYFKSKQEAWNYFSQSIGEYYGGRDFWWDFDWNDKNVGSMHADELGTNHCILKKWKDFDNDIKLRWEYKGCKYKSLNELCEAYPEFEGCTVSDGPWIYPENHKYGDMPALLTIEFSPEFKEGWEEKEFRLFEIKTEPSQEVEEILRPRKRVETEELEEEWPF